MFLFTTVAMMRSTFISHDMITSSDSLLQNVVRCDIQTLTLKLTNINQFNCNIYIYAHSA